MTDRSPAEITLNVDVTNPGQFFACCGLLELADRLWPGAEGWFQDDRFMIACEGAFGTLLTAVVETPLDQLAPDDEAASPMRLGGSFKVTLDWWQDELAGGKALKVWAGSMRGVRIARAMRHAIPHGPDLRHILDYGTPVFDPDNPRKKVEPYYFDSRRGWNAKSLDIGFAPDSFNMTSAAFPAVEFFCLIGLQRFRPALTAERRVFIYHTWNTPLSIVLGAAAAPGALSGVRTSGYRFENAFRTDQKKHKSFLPATPIGGSQ
jgi:CRISPR-associated protein Csx14